MFLAAYAVSHSVEHDEFDDTQPPGFEPDGTPATVNSTISNTSPKDEHAPKNGHHHHHSDPEMEMGEMGRMNHSHHHNHTIVHAPISPEEMSYWLWPEHQGLFYAHISIMIVSWGFVLPAGMTQKRY